MPKLVCQSGPTAGHEYPLAKDVTILGRQSSCDVQVQDEMSSRAHCQIRRDGQLYSLVDLGSRNGTLLNGKKVSERLLSFGDVIRIGKAEYVLVKEPKDLELRDLLSKYEIQEKLGEGGMGIVYKANQRSMARVVALKILSPKYSSKPKFVEQFTREARAAGSLNHPNIIQVHDVGTENGIHYFSMEFVDGPTCMQVLKSQGPFPVPDALEIIRQTARALEYAHSHRLIHQDIKPDNIMLGPNNIVKLADLGISKTFDEAESDDVKKVMGTPHYMAPEAALGKKVDQRVDIYSLGATAYHLLSGKTPYHGSSPTEVLKHHVMDPLPPITDINPEVPPKVVALIEKMMAKKPEDRLQSAHEVVEEIRQVIGSESSADRVGGETMILRRYAQGGPAAASVPTPASLTTGSRTPGAETTTPGEGGEGVEADMRLRLLNRLLAGGIVLAVLACIVIVTLHVFSGAKPGAAATPPPGGGVAVSPPPQPVDFRPDPLQEAHDKAARELDGLEHQLQGDPDALNLPQLRQELDRITDENLDRENLTRAKSLGDTIDSLLQRRHTDQLKADFEALGREVRSLMDTHEYDTALARLDSFAGRLDGVIKPSFDKLRENVESERDQFHKDMLTQIDEAYALRQEVLLKDLRDNRLPRSYLGSDLEKRITADIADLERQAQQEMEKTVQEGVKLLVSWHLEDFLHDYDQYRPQMNGAAAQHYDGYHDAVLKVQEMIAALGRSLRARTTRFRGIIHTADSPDLVDATSDDGLQMLDPNGVHIAVHWPALTEEEISAVCTQVLGKKAAAEYSSSIKVLWELKPPPKPH